MFGRGQFPREEQKHSRGIRNIAYGGFPARLTSAVKRYDVKSASMQNVSARAHVSKCAGEGWKELEPMLDAVLSHKWRYALAKRGRLIHRYLSYRAHGIAQ